MLPTALQWAKQITENSPDSVQSTKRALLLSNQFGDVEDVVVAHTRSKEMLRVYGSDNLKVHRQCLILPCFHIETQTLRMA